MSSDNHETAAWESIKGFTYSDYENLNPRQPEQPFMQMWAVIVCLRLVPMRMSSGDLPDDSRESQRRKTYVGWWKAMQAPLPIQDDLTDDALNLLQERFLLFFEKDLCRGILKENVWIGKGVMKIIGAWTAYLTRFVLETIYGKMSLQEASNAPNYEGMRRRAKDLLEYLYPKLAFTTEQATELQNIWDYALVQMTSAFLGERARSVTGPGRVAETCLSGICTAWDTHESSLSQYPQTIDSRASEASNLQTDIECATENAVNNHLARMSQTESKYWEIEMMEIFHRHSARHLADSSSASGHNGTRPN